MSEILMGVVAGAKLGVFALLFAYTYLLDRSTDLPVSSLLLLAGAFIVIVLGELLYISGQAGQTIAPWLTDFQNLQFFANVFELVVVAGAVLFLRSLREHLEG